MRVRWSNFIELELKVFWVWDIVRAVVASNIKIESDANITNVVLAAKDKLEVGSKVTIGYPGFCSTGAYTAYLFSKGTIDIGSNNNLYGVQMASTTYLKIQSGNPSNYKSVYGETMGLLEYQSANQMSACGNLIGSAFGKSTNPFGISVLALVD